MERQGEGRGGEVGRVMYMTLLLEMQRICGCRCWCRCRYGPGRKKKKGGGGRGEVRVMYTPWAGEGRGSDSEIPGGDIPDC